MNENTYHTGWGCDVFQPVVLISLVGTFMKNLLVSEQENLKKVFLCLVDIQCFSVDWKVKRKLLSLREKVRHCRSSLIIVWDYSLKDGKIFEIFW